MKQVDNKEFFKKLQKLLELSNEKGSVYLVQKQLPLADLEEEENLPRSLIFRASNGAPKGKGRISVSTIVTSDDLPQFWTEYAEILKKGTPGLLKKDKRKKKEKKDKKLSL